MASTTTPIFFKTHNNQTPKSPPLPLPQPTTTNPKPRSRKSSRAQKGPNKTPQRGMGVEKLEIELHRQEGTSPTHRILASKFLASNTNNTNNNNNNNNNNGFSNICPLPGVPVHPYPVTLSNYYFPGQRGPSPLRALSLPDQALELPSMPNHNITTTLSYKKKRIDGEKVGFGNKGKEKQQQQQFGDYYCDQGLQMPNDVINHGINNYGGFDSNNTNNYQHFAVNNNYPDFTPMTATQVMGIQKKMSRTSMMEYGFFPGKSDTVNEELNIKDFDNNNNNNNNNCDNNNNNNNNYYYYYKGMDYLDLKLGCFESSYNTTSSPSSSLTTATTATTTTTTTTNAAVSDTFLDLSLKLSNY